MKKLFALSLVLIMALSATALGDGEYVNEEFGFRITLPRDYTDMTELISNQLKQYFDTLVGYSEDISLAFDLPFAAANALGDSIIGVFTMSYEGIESYADMFIEAFESYAQQISDASNGALEISKYGARTVTLLGKEYDAFDFVMNIYGMSMNYAFLFMINDGNAVFLMSASTDQDSFDYMLTMISDAKEVRQISGGAA